MVSIRADEHGSTQPPRCYTVGVPRGCCSHRETFQSLSGTGSFCLRVSPGFACSRFAPSAPVSVVATSVVHLQTTDPQGALRKVVTTVRISSLLPVVLPCYAGRGYIHFMGEGKESQEEEYPDFKILFLRYSPSLFGSSGSSSGRGSISTGFAAAGSGETGAGLGSGMGGSSTRTTGAAGAGILFNLAK